MSYNCTKKAKSEDDYYPNAMAEDCQKLVSDLRHQIKFQNEKYECLKEDIYLFQKAAGFDFIPEKTKVFFSLFCRSIIS